jgi:hypothetical protein
MRFRELFEYETLDPNKTDKYWITPDHIDWIPTWGVHDDMATLSFRLPTDPKTDYEGDEDDWFDIHHSLPWTERAMEIGGWIRLYYVAKNNELNLQLVAARKSRESVKTLMSFVRDAIRSGQITRIVIDYHLPGEMKLEWPECRERSSPAKSMVIEPRQLRAALDRLTQ